MKKLILILISFILLTSCAMQTIGITALREKDSVSDLNGMDAHWQGGEVEEEWHRLHSEDYNQAAKDLGYFFGYITSIKPEGDRLMVTVENYGDNIKSGAYRFPVYDSTPIVKYVSSYQEPDDLYVGMMTVIVYYDYSPSDAKSPINDVVAYTVKIMNNEKISSLPEDMDFIMDSTAVDVDEPVEVDIGSDIVLTSAKSGSLSENEIAALAPDEFRKWYESRLSEYLEKNKSVRFYFGYVADYRQTDGKTDIVVTNRDGTSIDFDSFNVRIFDSTVVTNNGKTLTPDGLKVGQKVIIAYYVWDIDSPANPQAVYHVEILDTKDKPDPLPEGIVDIHHGDSSYIPVEGEEL